MVVFSRGVRNSNVLEKKSTIQAIEIVLLKLLRNTKDIVFEAIRIPFIC